MPEQPKMNTELQTASGPGKHAEGRQTGFIGVLQSKEQAELGAVADKKTTNLSARWS